MIMFALVAGSVALGLDDGEGPGTRVAIVDGRWQVDGRVTHPGSPAEGLLMNARMVNATFEDRDRPGFDPEANTDAFLDALPRYAGAGIRAITLGLQGGMPGYEGAVNSAFEPDGSLRASDLGRVARVIEACDRLGVVVILGCYYQRQDQVLRDEDAVREGVANVARWLKERGRGNVVLEVANEFGHRGFDHEILRSPEGQVELIEIARRECPDLLVSTSGLGNGRLPGAVAEAADFLLIHFNDTPIEAIPERVAALRRFGKPIVCNEDDRTGADAADAAGAAVAAGASYGLMLKEVNQSLPFEFDGPDDDPAFYDALGRLTAAP